MKLTRSVSVDPSMYRPTLADTKLTDLVINLRSVHTAPAVKPAKSDSDSPKFDLLRFRNQYRESIATNVMSELNDDFKIAYEKGDAAQRRNLENVATMIYLAKAHTIGDENRDKSNFESLLNAWFTAIKNGNKKPDSYFTVEQNFSVNRKNKERDSYQKAVNELGIFLKDRFDTPKALAKVVMTDVQKRCNDVLSHHGLDISSVPQFLEQTAFNAEKNIRHAVNNLTSPGREGIAFIKQATIHVNSMLNYPNYLRDILSKADQPPVPAPPAQPQNPNITSPDVPAEPVSEPDGNIHPSPAAPSPVVVNLSNIGNPTVHVDLGDKLDRLAEKLEKLAERGNTVYHIHHYHICECKHVHGSSSLPHNFTSFTQSSTVSESDNGPRSGGASVFPDLHAERFNTSGVADGYDESNHLSSESIQAESATDSPEHGVEEAMIEEHRINVDGDESASGSSASAAIEAADITENRVSEGAVQMTDTTANTSSMAERIRFFDQLFNQNQTVASEAIRFSPQQVSSPTDTFIAKQERAGNPVTLSQTGLLRPNLAGSNSSSFTVQNQQRAAVGVDNSELTVSESFSENKTFISRAYINVNQGDNGLEFDASTVRSPQRQSSAEDMASQKAPDSELTVEALQDDAVDSGSQRVSKSGASTPGHVRDLVSFFNSSIRDVRTAQSNTAKDSALPSVKNETGDVQKLNMTAENPVNVIAGQRYSPYLDEKGDIKSPITLTVDGLHMSRN